jgi:CheY-like chemotaxis protein
MGRRILTDAGYEVVTVNNGSAALKKIAEQKPDLIVLDVYMPGYGGLEVCQRIKETKETARIPVLLTVGKLEPFKPEEARRVRADAFIVKPFEASELLTALTRLEDKIVPHAEPYKPGRFARAIAAAEQAEMGEGFGDKETGWKDRLSIPSPTAKPAESEPEVPHSSSAAFRDLARGGESKSEPSGFERPIPAGLPTDITPEEIAAITAAAAAVRDKVAVPPAQPQPVATESAEPEPALPEASAAESPAATFASAPEAKTEAAAQTTPSMGESQPAAEVAATSPATVAEASGAATADQPTAPAETDSQPTSAPEVAAQAVEKPAVAPDEEVAAALASLVPANGHSIAPPSEQVPAAVAATIAELTATQANTRGPRWMAEEISVGENESTLLLEQEMEKAYAAFAAADAARMNLAAASLAAAAGITEAVMPPVAIASPVPVASIPEEPVTSGPPVAEPAASTAEEPVGSVAAVANTGESVPAAEVAASPAESVVGVSVAREEAAYAAAASASSAAESATVEAVSQPIAVPQPAESSQAALEESDPQREAELAAAWANWRQIRESIVGSPLTAQIADVAAAELIENQPVESASAKAEETAAVAEPAGEEPSGPVPSDSTAIASIVDSVLAELKPKLVEEIAKKMSNEKKKKKKKD